MVGIGEGSVGCITTLDLHGPHGSMNTKGKRCESDHYLYVSLHYYLNISYSVCTYIIWDECGGRG